MKGEDKEKEMLELKRIEISIDIKKGEIFTSEKFINKLGLDAILTDQVRRARFFYEIVTLLDKLGAIKKVGTQKSNKKRGRSQIVYKAIKNIKMTWVFEEE